MASDSALAEKPLPGSSFLEFRSTPRYVEVAVDTPILRGAKTYTYRVPDGLEIRAGQCVRVPFGKQELDGVVLGLAHEALAEARPLTRTTDMSLLPYQLELAQWLSSYYAAPINDALGLFLPPALVAPKVRRIAGLAAGIDLPAARQELARAPRQLEVLEALLLTPQGMDARALPSETGFRQLVQRGLATVRTEEYEALPVVPATAPIVPLRLTQSQQDALSAIRAGSGVFLLHGVTGSGKTEVYLQAIADAVDAGKQAVMLVPEISLTPQTIARCAARFSGRVAVLHSALSQRERSSEWQRIRAGSVDVVIGPRSALFAPLQRLGLIVMDEEHDWTYKQEQSPRYHARDVAVQLAGIVGAKVILGSATPDVGSYYRAQKGTYTLLTLPDRISFAGAGTQGVGRSAASGDSWMPPVHIVDMRQELQAGNRSIFSRELATTLRETVLRKEQTILFLNRRGASTFVICRECGYVLECQDCLLPFTFHAVGTRLMCHNCGKTARTPERCPDCSSQRIRYFGLGTQRVVEEVEALLPQARVMRWDRDTARTRGEHEAIVDAMREHRVDILVGTQMVAKGHDLPMVTLVGVISADAMLHLPDFRAAERTFQLLTQVSGRAGRGPAGGAVIVQTYNPQHPTIAMASRHDYHAFFRQEIQFRKQMGYPPYSRVVKFVFSHTKAETCEREARKLFEVLAERVANHDPEIHLTGPLPAFLEKSHGKFRWLIIARGVDVTPVLIQDLPTGWTIDVDPASVL